MPGYDASVVNLSFDGLTTRFLLGLVHAGIRSVFTMFFEVNLVNNAVSVNLVCATYTLVYESHLMHKPSAKFIPMRLYK